MTLKNANDPLSGGTITFNGITVVIPENLLVNLPALTAVSWPEMSKSDGSPNLPLWPQVNWEVQVSFCVFVLFTGFDAKMKYRCMPISSTVNMSQESSISFKN